MFLGWAQSYLLFVHGGGQDALKDLIENWGRQQAHEAMQGFLWFILFVAFVLTCAHWLRYGNRLAAVGVVAWTIGSFGLRITDADKWRQDPYTMTSFLAVDCVMIALAIWGLVLAYEFNRSQSPHPLRSID
jgi:hypothetical protein